ncbi:hypothetical protein [Caballeronia sp. GaOx3]|uniref:hypothetical protein n=1 Tax=Caballeronia sp. GaOx3 TaxID=2921740 RepID=UPI002027FF17|nr:hypothetical protein [Caballeronia sp. GaOx3]
MPTTITPAAEVRPDALRMGPCTALVFLAAAGVDHLSGADPVPTIASDPREGQALLFRDGWLSSKRSLVRAD